MARLAIAMHERQRRTFNNRATRAPSESDPNPIRKYDFGATMGPFVGHFFSEPELGSQYWEVCVLAVHPKYQRCGVGAELVAWGTERANAENVPCIVISSTGSEKWYQKQGFETYVGCAGTVDRVVDGEVVENPMKHRVTSGGHIYKTKV
jgi:ribosomal protein S18 acetylase RimI-like enzyme